MTYFFKPAFISTNQTLFFFQRKKKVETLHRKAGKKRKIAAVHVEAAAVICTDKQHLIIVFIWNVSIVEADSDIGVFDERRDLRPGTA